MVPADNSDKLVLTITNVKGEIKDANRQYR